MWEVGWGTVRVFTCGGGWCGKWSVCLNVREVGGGGGGGHYKGARGEGGGPGHAGEGGGGAQGMRVDRGGGTGHACVMGGGTGHGCDRGEEANLQGRSVCASMCACMHPCVCVCVCVCVHAFGGVRGYVHIRVHACMHTCVCICVYAHMCMRLCVRVRVCGMCMCVRVLLPLSPTSYLRGVGCVSPPVYPRAPSRLLPHVNTSPSVVATTQWCLATARLHT